MKKTIRVEKKIEFHGVTFTQEEHWALKGIARAITATNAQANLARSVGIPKDAAPHWVIENYVSNPDIWNAIDELQARNILKKEIIQVPGRVHPDDYALYLPGGWNLHLQELSDEFTPWMGRIPDELVRLETTRVRPGLYECYAEDDVRRFQIVLDVTTKADWRVFERVGTSWIERRSDFDNDGVYYYRGGAEISIASRIVEDRRFDATQRDRFGEEIDGTADLRAWLEKRAALVDRQIRIVNRFACKESLRGLTEESVDEAIRHLGQARLDLLSAARGLRREGSR